MSDRFNADNDIEGALHDLFHEPEPDPAFMNQLEKRLLMEARQDQRHSGERQGRGAIPFSFDWLNRALVWGGAAAVLALVIAVTLLTQLPRSTQVAMAPTQKPFTVESAQTSQAYAGPLMTLSATVKPASSPEPTARPTAVAIIPERTQPTRPAPVTSQAAAVTEAALASIAPEETQEPQTSGREVAAADLAQELVLESHSVGESLPEVRDLSRGALAAPAEALQNRQDWRSTEIVSQKMAQAFAEIGFHFQGNDLYQRDKLVLAGVQVFSTPWISASGDSYGLVLQKDAGTYYILQKGRTLTVNINADREVRVMDGERTLATLHADQTESGTIQGLGAWKDHWALEIAQSGRATLIVDGHNLNKELGFEEAFGWRLLNGKPFFFFRKGGKVNLFYSGQILPHTYEEVVHYTNTPLDVQGNEQMVWFYGKQDGAWQYVELGTFKDQAPKFNSSGSQKPLGGTTVSGQVVQGYGSHKPVADLVLQIVTPEQGVSDPLGKTDANGNFTLSGLPKPPFTLFGKELQVEVSAAEQGGSIDLGSLKFPLSEPDPAFTQKPASVDAALVARQGESLAFTVCQADSLWQRPSEAEQRERVWSQRPFADLSEAERGWWFEQPAVLYNSVDLFRQSFPGGPRLNEAGLDWRYLLGMWNGKYLFDSQCSYAPEALQALLDREQVEVWLLNYRATAVKQMGEHYIVEVQPATGFQVIRFAGNEGALDVRVYANAVEVARLDPAIGER